jgi:hypothetical protein
MARLSELALGGEEHLRHHHQTFIRGIHEISLKLIRHRRGKVYYCVG